MVEQTHTWPVGLRRLAEVIGPAAAVRMADVLGGIENVYIPKKARIDHEITAIIGIDRMENLCAEFGGSQIDIPRGAFKDLKKTQIMDAKGSNREVALRLVVLSGMSVKFVLKSGRKPIQSFLERLKEDLLFISNRSCRIFAPINQTGARNAGQNFMEALETVLSHEGGLLMTGDPGGATNFGVSLRFLATQGEFDSDGDGVSDYDFDRDGDIDADDIRRMTRAMRSGLSGAMVGKI